MNVASYQGTEIGVGWQAMHACWRCKPVGGRETRVLQCKMVHLLGCTAHSHTFYSVALRCSPLNKHPPLCCRCDEDIILLSLTR